MGYGGTAEITGEVDIDVEAIVNGIAGEPGSEATLGELATQETLAALDTKAGALATELTLAAMKARADLLATEASLAALKSRSDLLGTEATLLALKNRGDLLATQATLASLDAEFDDYANDDALDSPLYGDSVYGRLTAADILADLHTGDMINTMNNPLHGSGMIWDEYGWEIDPLGMYSIGDMIANTFTQTGPGMGENVLGFEGPLFSYAGCCGARGVAQILDELCYNVSGWGSPLYYDWNSLAYIQDLERLDIATIKADTALIKADIAAMNTVLAKLTFDGSNHLEVHTNA